MGRERLLFKRESKSTWVCGRSICARCGAFSQARAVRFRLVDYPMRACNCLVVLEL